MASVLFFYIYIYIKSFELCKLWTRTEIEVVVVVVMMVMVVVSAAVIFFFGVLSHCLLINACIYCKTEHNC